MKRILSLLMMFVFSTPLFASNSVWKESVKEYEPYYNSSLSFYSFVGYFDAVKTTTKNGSAMLLLAAPVNDECAGAIDLPVNPAFDCIRTLTGTFKEATNSALGNAPITQPTCNPTAKRDVWYKFVATSKIHQLGIEVPGVATWTINVAVYDKADCSLIKAAAFSCFNLTNAAKTSVLTNLVIGRIYYVRLGNTTANDYPFTLCLTTAPPPMRVSPSGEQYTVEELVTDVLVKSGCNLVSNITYKVGNGSPATKLINTLGYFNKNNSIFPFDEGVVLGTNEVQYIGRSFEGPYAARGNNTHRWGGDKDLNDAINDTGGNPTSDKQMRVTQLEFDFVPVKDTIKFEYLFASNSYVQGCTYDCGNGALFAAWLIDTTNGVGENLAKLPGTNTPIALNTVRDTGKSGAACVSVNPQYYWNHYDGTKPNNSNPLGAPFDFIGSTVGLSSRTVKVIPGRKYHIKLAVMDFCPTLSHSSAVFFNARSFDIGTPDLGKDFVIEGGNAICPGGSLVLGGDLDPKDYTIQWTKNGIDIVGENGPKLVVTDKGTYGVKLNYKNVVCYLEPKPVTIEFFDDIIIEKVPQNLVQCKAPGATTLFNLEEATKGVTHHPVIYSFYENKQDAIDDIAAIPPYYSFDNTFNAKTVWVRVQSAISPCFKVFSFTIKTEPCVIGLVPLSPLRICNAPGSTFDLTVYDNIVYHGIPGFKVEYYKSNADAMAQIDPIVGANAYNGAHHDFIFVRVSSLSDPTLYAITSFELLRDVIPVVNKNVSPLIACVDASSPLTAFFNLNTKDNEVKLSASGLVVEYYLSQAEANTGDVTKSLPKWNYQSGEKTVWVRVYSPSSACYSITSLDLKFNIAPILVGPNEYIVCDNLGISTFDLTVIASDQKGLNIKWKHGFFRTFSEASSNSNPINVKDGIYTNSKPGGEPVYMRVEDAFGCVTIKAIDLFVKSKPRTSAPSDFSICDTNGSGVTFFDLTSKAVEILAGLTASDYHVYYYASNSLAIEGDFDKAIKDPNNFSNLTSNTVYVRVEDKTTGCYSVELIHLKTVTLPDVATSVTDYVVCDSKAGTGKMKFVLASKKPEITSSLSLKISFYESRTDAESALKPIDENNYINKDAYTQTVYARVEDVKSGCFKIVSINLIVNTYPPFDTAGNIITVCSTSNSGIGIFNLIEHGKKYIPSYNNFDFNFFESLENAEKNVNKIVDPEAYSNVKITQTKVWIRIVNKVTGCVGIYDFELKVNKAPTIVGKLPVTVLCDNYTNLFDGKALFDLTIHESSIIPGVVSGHGSSVSYYKSQADADKAENAISSPKNYVSGGAEETIWYRLLDTTTGCSVVGSFNLRVTIGLELTKPQDLLSCSDVSLGQNFAYFDLTTHKLAIVGGVAVFGTTYFYYESEADALAGTNAIATANLTKYKNKTAVQSIWMVVVNEHGCRSMTIQTLIVYATPNPSKSATLSTCEGTVGTGSAVFDLRLSVDDIINGDTNLDLYFYGTRALAEEGDPTKTIAGPDKYTSTSKTIYVRVENKLALISPKCYVIVELKLVVNAIPTLKDLKPLLACLDQVVDYYDFTLTDKDAEILNGRLASDYRITYYATQIEAQENKKPLPYNYKNQTAKTQTIWVRLENKATGCFNVKRLLLQIELKVDAFDPVVKEYCDDNDKVGTPVNDGFTSIDLTVYSLEIIGAQPDAANLIVTYYASLADYNANNPILTPNDYVNISSPQTIIAVVKNKSKDLYCSALVELKIVVNKLPEVITDLEGGYLCKDLETGQVTPFLIDSKLDSSLYEFIWQFNGVEIPGAKLSYYEAKLAGNYTVSTVSKATGCASVNSATVTLTALAPFSITIDDTTGNRDEISENGKQTIIVNVLDQKTPSGVYEFALNDGSYQNSNVFYDVVAGEHLVWVRDRLTGACAVSKLISVMNYPKFFTPNGDGHNDTWNIKGLSVQPDAKIYIFDRFGKLLKQLSPAGEGWDGTFGGRPVPSTDYWFTVEYNDFQGNRREFKGHFSLKR